MSPKTPPLEPGSLIQEARPLPQAGVQSLKRAISILRAVASLNEPGARLSQIAAAVGLHVATAQRMLKLLAAEGLISYDPAMRLYRLGMELFLLGGAAQQYALRDRYRTSLERIAHETGETAFLLIRSGHDVLCLDRVEGRYPIKALTIDIGARRPLGIGAGSLALIIHDHPARFEMILKANAPRYPQFRNLTARDVRKVAEAARPRGYVVSQGLFHEGVTSVGVPLREGGMVVASITVSAISARMDLARAEEIYHLVLAATTEAASAGPAAAEVRS